MKSKCKKCGAAMKKGAKFCSECGMTTDMANEQENDISTYNLNNIEVAEAQEESKASSKKKFLIVIIIIVVAAVIAVFAVISNSNYNQFVKAYKAADGDLIDDIYADMSTAELEKSREFLLTEAQKAYDAYMSGEMSFEEADDILVFVKKVMIQKLIKQL